MVAAIVLYTFLVPVRNRQPPVAAEGSRRNLYARRSLAALVLADVNQPHHAFDRLALEAHGQHLLEAAILFHISLQNWIEHLVWGQAVDILLARAQCDICIARIPAFSAHPSIRQSLRPYRRRAYCSRSPFRTCYR